MQLVNQAIRFPLLFRSALLVLRVSAPEEAYPAPVPLIFCPRFRGSVPC